MSGPDPMRPIVFLAGIFTILCLSNLMIGIIDGSPDVDRVIYGDNITHIHNYMFRFFDEELLQWIVLLMIPLWIYLLYVWIYRTQKDSHMSI